MIYAFTYEELKPLLDFLYKEALPTEHHYPGFYAIMKRLMQIKQEHENDSIGTPSQKKNN